MKRATYNPNPKNNETILLVPLDQQRIKKYVQAKTSLTIAALLICYTTCFCQFTIDQTNKTFTIDFNDFNGSGFSPTPTTGQLSSNTWSIKGMSDGNLNFGNTKTTASTDFTRGIHTGLVGSGGIYAFNTGNNIMMGVQPIGTDFTPGSFILRLQNLTGDSIKELFISYDIFSMNDQGRGNSFNFSYSIDSSIYINVPALDFATKDSAAINPIWEKTNRNILLTGITISPYSYFYFRWDGDDVNGTGNRDEYGIDNISVTANPLPVTADFGAHNVCIGAPVNFTDESSSVIDHVVSWSWDFGDSTIENTQNPMHVYQFPGSYNVQLIARVSQGHEDTIMKTVVVYPQPTAQFTTDIISGCAPLQVSFTDSSSITSGNIASWNWNFGDTQGGALNTDTNSNATSLFENEGIYICKLQVTSDFGCVNTDSVSITVNSVPHANFSYLTTGTTSVQFSDSSFISNGNLFYSWDFGDGDTSSAANPTHNYLSAGTYTIGLTVVSENGCSDSTTQVVTIVPSTTGIYENNEKNGFRFYPNPVSNGQLTIETSANASEILITNALGQVVIEKTIGGQLNTIHLAGILPGVYMITMITENSRDSQQLIIQ